ncbi:MAG: anaerobic ribonucleoside-triphosphate reductase activating protein [Euryarchaeota archaeon]|nr:anaerobic ribonucleoside-triphosphate reductase activating protein [Euryarchaeota archaeon]
MLIAGFIPESFVDWRGKIVATVFTHGCNFRCPFCHNHALVVGKPAKIYSSEEIITKIKELEGWIDGVCITGGEPTVHRDIVKFIEKVSKFMPVKLDTNGSNPETLAAILPLVDYVAMDIKAPPSRYTEIAGVPVNTRNIEKSIKIIKEQAKDYEFRTTFVPTLSREDIREIARWIAPARRYVIQQFSTGGGTLDSTFQSLSPHAPATLNSACAIASRNVEECIVANL